MNFGNVFTTLCCSIFILCSSMAFAQVDIPSNLNFKTIEAKDAYIDFIQEFDKCNNKKLRKNNPYPVSDWLISLPKNKQTNVIVYLYRLSIYNCSSNEQENLIEILTQRDETSILRILKKEGWFEVPVYGELDKDRDIQLIELTDKDIEALDLLINLNYLPFDGIGMYDLYQKLNVDN